MSPVIDLPSPCVSVCVLDPATGYCRGCLRTSAEIAGWSRLDNGAKLALLDRLRDRREELGLPVRRRPRRRRALEATE